MTFVLNRFDVLNEFIRKQFFEPLLVEKKKSRSEPKTVSNTKIYRLFSIVVVGKRTGNRIIYLIFAVRSHRAKNDNFSSPSLVFLDLIIFAIQIKHFDRNETHVRI